MTHEPKFERAIGWLKDQIARKDFAAALQTFMQTGYLPAKAVRRFVNEAPVTLATSLLHNFKLHCMTGLTKENVFDRSLNISSYLSACAVQSIIGYFREKQHLLSVIQSFGIPVPLVLVQTMREIEQGIKRSTPHGKFLASGFVRVYFDAQFSKYTHPELDFRLVVRTHKNEIRKLKQDVSEGCTMK
ncbi:MAG TPA: hypothetical protein VJ579_02220 [Candidatus Paceibacterota bacterium]|nr:hypothetical protein [Candidatus Paceibacterota bacterium]